MERHEERTFQTVVSFPQVLGGRSRTFAMWDAPPIAKTQAHTEPRADQPTPGSLFILWQTHQGLRDNPRGSSSSELKDFDFSPEANPGQPFNFRNASHRTTL